MTDGTTTRTTSHAHASNRAESSNVEVAAPRTPPPRRPTLVNYLHSAVAIPLIYFYTIVMGSLSLLLSLDDPEGRKQHWCASTWSRMIVRTVGVKVRVRG